jgi:RimJ/RimL family protein N-acetyltransferase
LDPFWAKMIRESSFLKTGRLIALAPEPRPTFMRTSLGDFPRDFQTKNGQFLRLQILKPSLHPRFEEAYLAFRPRNSFQGLPPLKDEVCLKWVREMIDTGINLIAMSSTTGIVGHTALFPLDTRKCEMLVVVWPEFQNIGIGFELSRGCVQMACELGYEEMWLPVDATNLRARHIYTKCGFEYRSPKQSRELDMVCDLSLLRATQKKVTIAAKKIGVPAVHFDMNLATFPMSEQPIV